MSLPWNKTVWLRIDAQHVHASLRPAWRSQRTLASCQHPSPPSQAGAAGSPGQPPDSSFEPALSAALAELGAARGSQASSALVLVGNARVHLDVVSGDYAHLSDRQLQSVAQACVDEILGDRAPDHQVRWHLQRDLHHLVIAAIGSHDIEQIERIAREHGIKRISIQPEFTWQWNQSACALEGSPGVLASLADDHMVAAFAVSGSITAMTSGSTRTPDLAFDETHAQKGAIDDRVDRLLSSVGQDLSLVQAYLLVSSPSSEMPLDARWKRQSTAWSVG